MFVNKSLEIVYFVRQLLCSAQTKISFYLRKTITYFIVLKYPLSGQKCLKMKIEMLYLNTIEQFLLVEQLDQLEVCLPYCRLLE